MSIQSLPTRDERGFVEGVVTYLRRGNRSSSAVPKVQALLRRVTSRSQKEKNAMVETSTSLSKPEKDALIRALSRLMGYAVVVTVRINPELLGGIRVQVADWILDTSLAYQLESMGKELIDSNTRIV